MWLKSGKIVTPDSLVVDVSGAIYLLNHRSFAGIIVEAFEELISPPIYEVEMANICWKYVRFGQWQAIQAQQLLKASLDLTDRLSIDPISEVLDTALLQDLSAYDASYFHLCKTTGASLLSLDKKLNRIAKANGIECLIDKIANSSWPSADRFE